jgi:hypothetical protein
VVTDYFTLHSREFDPSGEYETYAGLKSFRTSNKIHPRTQRPLRIGFGYSATSKWSFDHEVASS